ncbi:MAG TPA: hypothetical protein VGZ26_11715 [Pirellulales bacterium]|jgi:hypothetical protein|nr:hypothetical protein [Pirellulales bacterium]
MVKRIFGGLLFLWMTAAVIGGGWELRDKQGTRFWTGVGAGVFCACLAAIGLTMAFGKAKPPDPSKG